MRENQKEGYLWSYTIEPEGVLKCIGDEWHEDDWWPDGGVLRQCVFQASMAGKATIMFEYTEANGYVYRCVGYEVTVGETGIESIEFVKDPLTYRIVRDYYSEYDSDTAITANPGDVICLFFGERESLPGRWAYSISDNTVMRMIYDEYKRGSNTSDTPGGDSAGLRSFYFEAASVGECTISMLLSYGSENPGDAILFSVLVEE